MPLFDFECASCHHIFEAFLLSGEEARCEKCGSTDLRKLISAPAPPGRAKGLVQGARKMAAREGHFSNYSRAERKKASR